MNQTNVRQKGGSRGPLGQNGCGAAGNFTDGFTPAPFGGAEGQHADLRGSWEQAVLGSDCSHLGPPPLSFGTLLQVLWELPATSLGPPRPRRPAPHFCSSGLGGCSSACGPIDHFGVRGIRGLVSPVARGIRASISKTAFCLPMDAAAPPLFAGLGSSLGGIPQRPSPCS